MSRETAINLAITGQPTSTTQNPTAPIEGVNAPAPTPAAETSTDPRLQTLLKKETDLVRQRETFNRQKQEWETKSKQADEVLGRAKQFEELVKNDPVAALKLIGYSETQIFNVMAAANEPAKEKTAEEIARETAEKILKERDETDQKTRSEQMAKAQEQTVAQGIKSLVTNPANLERFELCALSGEPAQDQIKQTLYQFVSDDQKEAQSRGIKFELTEEQANNLLEEAALAVEGLYRENIKDMSSTKAFSALMKELGWTKAEIQAAVDAQSEKPKMTTTVVPQPQLTPTAPRPKTLTNRVSATTASLTGTRPETPAQKRARLEQVLITGDKSLLRG